MSETRGRGIKLNMRTEVLTDNSEVYSVRISDPDGELTIPAVDKTSAAALLDDIKSAIERYGCIRAI